jgi:hypothetical protein
MNGIMNSCAELSDFLISQFVKDACLQETKLNTRSKQPFFPDYAFMRRDRPVGGGGGLAILIHHSVSFDCSSLTEADPSLSCSHYYWRF